MLTNRSDVGDFAREQFLGQRIDERRITRDQRQPRMKLCPFLIDSLCVSGNQRRQKGRGHLGIRVEVLDDVRELVRFRTDQAADESCDAGRDLVLLQTGVVEAGEGIASRGEDTFFNSNGNFATCQHAGSRAN